MRVGMITNAIDEGHPSYTVYTYNLIKNLNLLDKENEYYLIHHTKIDLDIYRTNKEVIVPLPPFKPLKRLLWRYIFLPKKLKTLELDIVHDPCGISIISFDIPFKKVITIHSLMSIFYPKYNIGGWLAYKLFGKKISKADRVITVSKFLKQELIKYLKVPEEKIKVIYNGKDEKFKPVDQEEIAEIKQRYNLDSSFILYVGVLQPLKNIPTLIKAYYKLKKKGIKHKLVIAGGKGWMYKEIFRIIEKLNLQKEIIFTGHVPNDELPKLYAAADLFVFPSIYEGFGMPPLEAMACGTPVITSDRGALPEVVGDAGIMVNPYDVDELANEMYRVLNDDSLKKDMIKKGLKRAKMFSWEKCAKEVLKVYEELRS